MHDLPVSSFHQSYAVNKRKAKEATSSVRPQASQLYFPHTITWLQALLAASHSSDFWLFLAQKKIFQAKPLIVCFLAQEMKGVIVSSQECPEGLLANVHLYYILQHSKSSIWEENSFWLISCSLSSPHKNNPVIDIFYGKVFSSILFLSRWTVQASVVGTFSWGKCYCPCSCKDPPALSKWGCREKQKRVKKGISEVFWAALSSCTSYPLFA